MRVVSFAINGVKVAILDTVHLGKPSAQDAAFMEVAITRHRVVIERSINGNYTLLKDNVGVFGSLAVIERQADLETL